MEKRTRGCRIMCFVVLLCKLILFIYLRGGDGAWGGDGLLGEGEGWWGVSDAIIRRNVWGWGRFHSLPFDPTGLKRAHPLFARYM